MSNPELLRLQYIEVNGLFGIYDHKIQLNLEERVTLLHGPNGVGKTVVLRMVNALLLGRLSYFRSIPFHNFTLTFNDTSVLQLKKSSNNNSAPSGHVLQLTNARGPVSHSTELRTSPAERIAEETGYMISHGELPDMWIDTRDGEVVPEEEFLRRFSSSIWAKEYHDSSRPDWFVDFLQSANAHLIEAQRLVRLDWTGAEFHISFGRHHPPPTASTVVERSREFQKRVADTMASYGRYSQTLDQSFPRRLMSATERMGGADLQAHLSDLNNRTSELMSMGILDETPMQPFPIEDFEDMHPTNAGVMTLYIADTQNKLNVLDDLATRGRLLLENVNGKFKNKRIRFDRENGFIAESTGRTPLPLSSLSSGEQHELVLNYDLLFRVPSNTVVLIDEPELSLHVAWQKSFLSDLLNIVNLSDFDAVVATHSPFIVGDRDDLMIGLGESG